MIKNYLKITIRNILKFKSYSAINIFGLSIGMACCIMILVFVMDELSYDRYHENADRIYRVTREFLNADGTTNLHLGPIAPPFGPLLKNDFPEIEHLVRFFPWDSPLISFDDKNFVEDNFFYAEPSVFDIFTFPLVQGDPESALAEPNSVVITEEIAEKYFGGENAMGKILTYKNRNGVTALFEVTGVLKNIPRNSHFRFDFLVSFITYENAVGQSEMASWGSNNYPTYFLLSEGVNIDDISRRFPDFLDSHMPVFQGMQPHEWTRLVIQKLTDIHLYSHLDSEIEANGDITIVQIYSAIAALILLIACINFMNLATARSARRAKEVGLRKVVGATKVQIMRQFFGESITFAFLSMALAIILVLIFLPYLSDLASRELSLSGMSSFRLLAGLTGIIVFVGIVAGSYPALFLSRFKPITVLQGGKNIQTQGSWFRSILVVSQFVISIGLIVSMSIVNGQLDFVRNKQLGFNKERVVVLPTNADIIRDLGSVKNRLLQNPGIVSVSAAKRVPSGRLLDSSGTTIYRDDQLVPIQFRIAMLMIDHDYFDTYEMPIVAGRNFSKEIDSDSTEAFVINEIAVKRLGWDSPQDAVGEQYDSFGRNGRIIGVVKDFHFESMHNEIAPMVFFITSFNLNSLSIRLRPGDIAGTMDFLRGIWLEYRPNYPFSYYFIDERFDALYANEEKLGNIFGIFSGIAVFIACLGLLGLVAFTTEQRTKEIGIRKVLGAKSSDIVFLIAKEFIRLVIAANIVAVPIIYYLMNDWLQSFAYRIEISYPVFIVAALLTLFITLATVGYQAIKASLTNPIETIRYQ